MTMTMASRKARRAAQTRADRFTTETHTARAPTYTWQKPLSAWVSTAYQSISQGSNASTHVRGATSMSTPTPAQWSSSSIRWPSGSVSSPSATMRRGAVGSEK
ncbi:hypothetical protein HJFPF1_01800 [Paramyrothecium foliicola]|nr:hypothetical protein HJFPF1_01800 [Paramyrothecium foliicola]